MEADAGAGSRVPAQSAAVNGDDSVGEVAAKMFAGGMTIAQVAQLWEREPAWVEEAIRCAWLASIPRRDGGLKVPRAEERAERSSDALDDAQGVLLWPES